MMSTDGHFPKFFAKTNSHGVPGHSMAFNVVCAIIVVFMGGAVQIYTFSNVGYLFSFIPVLIGYYLLRKDRPDVRRPFKLPEFMKYVALGIALMYAIIYFWGGPVYAVVFVQRGGQEHAPVLLPRDRRAARVLPAVLVPQECPGQEGQTGGGRADGAEHGRRSRTLITRGGAGAG